VMLRLGVWCAVAGVGSLCYVKAGVWCGVTGTASLYDV
jgi:hypothetical protein